MIVTLLGLLVGMVACMAEQDVPTLKDVFKNHFLIGGALNGRVVAGRDPDAAAGVKVMVTELDIRTQSRGYRGADIGRVSRASTDDSNAASTETQKKLADKYAEIFSVLLKHKEDITRVTFWGVYDGASWIGGSPLLFDRSGQPKEAFFAVVKAAKGSQ